ncbi:MAG: GNVR domain-containing protein [Sphingomonadaceae bacterium]
MSLIQFLRILIARRWMILLPALACLLVATAIAMMLPKRYPATARVILDIVKPDPVTGEAVAGRNPLPYIRTEIQLIKDMRVAGLVVDRLGLTQNPGMVAAYEETGRSVSDGGMRNWVGQRIVDNTDAKLVSGSNILEILYEAPDPEQARQIVGALRDAYIESSLRYRVDSAASTGNWFREQATKAHQALTASEKVLADYMAEHNIVLVDGMDSETAQLQALAATVQAVRSNEPSSTAAATAQLGRDPVVSQLRMQLATIEDELALAGSQLGQNHPSYKAILARKGTIERQIRMAEANSQTGVAAVTGATQQSLAQLERELRAQEQLVRERKPLIDELVRLSSDVTLKRSLYERAMARTEDLRMQADVSQTGLVVLGDPTSSTTPSYPKTPLIITLATLVGLAFGIFAAIVTEFAARRVRGQEDLAYASGAPVLVTVRATRPSGLRLAVRRLLGKKSDEPGTGGELQVI